LVVSPKRECRTRKGCTELWFLVQRFRGASGISKLPVEVSFSGIIIRECVYLDATNEAGNFFGATWRSPILSRKTGWGERHAKRPHTVVQRVEAQPILHGVDRKFVFICKYFSVKLSCPEKIILQNSDLQRVFECQERTTSHQSGFKFPFLSHWNFPGAYSTCTLDPPFSQPTILTRSPYQSTSCPTPTTNSPMTNSGVVTVGDG
jgi:hypothetical protein